MSLDQLQTKLDEATAAVDGRMARDAALIRELVAACRASLALHEFRDDHRGRTGRQLRKAIRKAEALGYVN